nr:MULTISPECIES: RluA family pseudouridine synthase [Oscillospiraceae]
MALTVTPEQAGRKIDTLMRTGLGLSGTVIRRVKWLSDGILLDGVRVHTDVRPRAGQVLSVLVADGVRRSGIVPAAGALDIVYEDADILILNKAPGVPVHPGPGHFSDTIGNFLLDYYDKEGIQADFHPVHRLDKGTSGLLVVAKHPHAQEALKNALHTPDFRRFYLAVCEGVPQPPAGLIDAPIGSVPGSLIARRVAADGQPSRTRYETLRTAHDRALLRLELETGRTHQIRVHMAHLGHPLTGDFLYGTEDPALISRPALHSAQLRLLHPVTGKPMTFTLPLPADMARLVE